MYTETMNDYIAKGYVRQLSKSEVKSRQNKISTTPCGNQHQQNEWT